MRFPALKPCRTLIAGSGLSAMEKAVRASREGNVLLVTEDTCLYAEIHRSGDYRMPRGLTDLQRELFFPEELPDADGLLHPDRLKLHGEAVMARHGVRLLYGCQVLGIREGLAILAHKSGMYAVPCLEALDAREAPSLSEPAYCLHTMHSGRHAVLIEKDPYPGNDARSRFLRYEQALSGLPEGSTLARGGMADTERDGIGLRGLPDRPLPPLPAGEHDPLRNDLIHADCVEISGGVRAETEEPYDVIIAGGGTAGAPAAVFSARAGMKTLLLEMNDRLGGTATAGGVSTYWFGLRTGATAMIDDAVSEYARRLNQPRKACLWNENDTFQPDLKAHVLLKMSLDAGAEVRFGCIVCGVEKRGQAVTGVYWAENGTLRFARAKMILDCTGDGDLAVFAGASSVYGSEKDAMSYWASLAQYPSPDRYRNNFSAMVHVGDPEDCTRYILAARKWGEDLYDHGQYLAVRESRHIRGMESVTLEDLLTLRPVRDGLYDCFSNMDPKGRMTADSAYFGLLCPNRRVSVPRGAVIPVDPEGNPLLHILVGGKAVSCTHDAFPLLRMQPDLQRQGLALAALAACAVRQETPAWLAGQVEETILSLGGDLPEPASAPAQPCLRDTVAQLRDDEPWEWLDAPPDSRERDVSPVIRIMTAPSEDAVPCLRAAWNEAPPGSARQLLLSRLLLWHGDELGAEAVMRAVREALDAESGLPRRKASVNYGQLLPDHGLMPETVYLLNSLARTKDAEVLPLFEALAERIEHSALDWRDIRAGVYCYIESFAYVAAGRGDAAFAPLLERMLRLPDLCAKPQDGLMRERLDMLKTALLHALHALGAASGTEGLRAFLKDERLPFRLAAESLLRRGGNDTAIPKR